MKTIKDMTFGGERPLFESHNLRMENITISDGESAIKECTNLEADGCRFFGKYPWWDKGADADNHTEIFPIMRPILNANLKLVQNPGYNK